MSESMDEMFEAELRQGGPQPVETGEGSYEERAKEALEAGDREEAIRIVEEGHARNAPTMSGDDFPTLNLPPIETRPFPVTMAELDEDEPITPEYLRRKQGLAGPVLGRVASMRRKGLVD